MAVNIYQGTKLLADTGIFRQGRTYVPSDSLANFSGSWDKETVFFNSPLAGKVLSIAILNSQGSKDELPPEIESFLNLCRGAGAVLRRYDGSGYPRGNIIIALELGQEQPAVKYLGFPPACRFLARKIAASLKTGLKLPYLADPVSFDKPRYNLKLKFFSRLFTPAVAVEWPEGVDIGPWLFASLMEYTGGGLFDAAPLLAKRQVALAGLAPEQAQPPAPHPELELPAAPSPAPPTMEATPPPPPALKAEQLKPSEEKKLQRRSAAMSPPAYPDLFFTGEKKMLVKEPFS